MKQNCNIKFFNYAGSKQYLVEKFNEFENQINVEKYTYIEPFLGSGSIFCNNSLNYSNYIINDKNNYIWFIWLGLQNLDYDKYLESYEYAIRKFGNFAEDKESYYKLRQYTNDNLKEFELYLSPFVYFNINSCINSMFRVSKNGLNQSYGNRFYMIKEKEFELLKKKLLRTELKNVDYYDLLKDSENTLYFIDPPYYTETKNSPGYLNNFTIKEHKKLVDILINMKKAKFVYTDYLSEYNKVIPNFSSRQILNISPINKNKNLSKEEFVFTNLNIDTKESWF